MRHNYFIKLAALSCDGALSVREQAALSAHTASCAECRERLAAAEELRRLFGRSLEGVALPRPVALPAPAPVSAPRSRRPLVFALPAGALAAAACAVLAVVLLRPAPLPAAEDGGVTKTQESAQASFGAAPAAPEGPGATEEFDLAGGEYTTDASAETQDPPPPMPSDPSRFLGNYIAPVPDDFAFTVYEETEEYIFITMHPDELLAFIDAHPEGELLLYPAEGEDAVLVLRK
jgi:hypothetical protein